MKVLRGLATAICSLLLFLALSVLSVAVLVNSTVLSPEFMNAQMGKLDTSEIAREFIDDEIREQLPQGSEFLLDVSVNVIKNEDTRIKTQITSIINNAYAYFLGDTDKLQLSVSLGDIKRDLKATIWDTTIKYLKNETANMSEAELNKYVSNIAVQIPTERYPAELMMLPEAPRDQIVSLYIKDLAGRAQFNPAAFGLGATMKDDVKNTVQQYLNSYIDEIPDTYTIDESTVGADGMKTLHDARTYIGYFKMGYIWLFVVVLVLAGLIFLINWSDVRTSMRSLGIDLIIFGVLDLAGIMVIKRLSLIATIPGYRDVPVSLQNWIQEIISDITGKMMIFSIAVVVIGAILLAVSFFIKRQQMAD